jgi:hypothetical protein
VRTKVHGHVVVKMVCAKPVVKKAAKRR